MSEGARGVVRVPYADRDREPTRQDDPVKIANWTSAKRNALVVARREVYFLAMLEAAVHDQAKTRRKLGVALDELLRSPLGGEFDERLGVVLQLAGDLRL